MKRIDSDQVILWALAIAAISGAIAMATMTAVLLIGILKGAITI